MKTYTTNTNGKIIVIHLGEGELILESIQKELQRLNIQNGILLSAIGSLRRASLHIITNTEKHSVNKYITIEKPIELGSAQGLILNGEPHLHLVISEPDGMYAGHMEPGCEVQYLAEISILELSDDSLTRELDNFGISYITQKK